MIAMDLYSTERHQLEHHQALVRQAELRAALMPAAGKPALAMWLADRMRRAADRLDPRPGLDVQRPVIIRSIRKAAP
jgi:hypothetical protein